MYEVQENNAPYVDVCKVGTSAKNRSEMDVLKAFSGLQCRGDSLDEWDSRKKFFKEKFTKGRQCLQRRITTMKYYGTNTENLRKTRRRHLFPIQVAYTYGRDCLRKFGTRADVGTFTRSVGDLFETVGKS